MVRMYFMDKCSGQTNKKANEGWVYAWKVVAWATQKNGSPSIISFSSNPASIKHQSGVTSKLLGTYYGKRPETDHGLARPEREFARKASLWLVEDVRGAGGLGNASGGGVGFEGVGMEAEGRGGVRVDDWACEGGAVGAGVDATMKGWVMVSEDMTNLYFTYTYLIGFIKSSMHAELWKHRDSLDDNSSYILQSTTKNREHHHRCNWTVISKAYESVALAPGSICTIISEGYESERSAPAWEAPFSLKNKSRKHPTIITEAPSHRQHQARMEATVSEVSSTRVVEIIVSEELSDQKHQSPWH
ncbi:hypothetical protein BJ508DRAFT_313002 [Ascobolus immersus RN42]|uniref:Uncharacterized protein n=1 Tax=Ascobolus immersus RN42 TaxID=1160509 RepID=A0A3N4HKH0_ASCIM|nr:hypothetical protein BJ508DRAFT_313002 [Ascobolus immersus RN42]